MSNSLHNDPPNHTAAVLLFVIIAATASTYNQQPTVSMRNATMLHPTMQQTSYEQADEAKTEINDTMIHGWQYDESLEKVERTPTVPQEFLPTSVRRPAPKSPYFLQYLHYVPKKGKRNKHTNNTATLSHKKPHPPTKPANVVKYEQTNGSQINVHEKYPLSLFNFGIELESCISFEDYEPDMSKFELGSDDTISCRHGSSNVEYRYRGVHTLADLTQQGSEIAQDIRVLDAVSTGCLRTSCGTHVHVSHSSVTKQSHPTFQNIVQTQWVKDQDFFIYKWYKFQARDRMSKWCRPNVNSFHGRGGMFRWAGDYGVRGLSDTWHFELR